MSDVSAVVPARNEEARIAGTVAALRGIGLVEVIVVDDASGDRTAQIAADAGARVISLPARRGKAGAVAAGLGEVRSDIVVLIDADLESTASIATSLVRAVRDGADLAIGAPPKRGSSGFGLVESFARLGIRVLTGRSLSRPLSGQRAARASVLRRLRLARGFGMEVSMSVDALRLGSRVEEVPVEFTHARTGKDLRGFVHRGRQGAHIAAALLRCAARPQRRGGARSARRSR